jgi:hypothetical protein
MAAGLAAVALGTACIPLAGSGGVLALALLIVHQIVGDAGHALYAVHDRTLRQTEVEASWLARADAGIRFAGQGATLAGALAGGLLGNVFGARSVLALCAVVTGAAACHAAWQLRALRQFKGEAKGEAKAAAAPGAG